MTTNNINFSHFIELALAIIYKHEQVHGPQGFIDMNQLAASLKQKIPPKWIWDATKVLESRRMVQAIYAIGGACYAQLTGEGRLFVEEERGSGIIQKYNKAPQQFVFVSGEGNQVVVSGGDANVTQTTKFQNERKPALDLLDEIQRTIVKESGLRSDEIEEIKIDIDMIRKQLDKREPNRTVLAALLDGLPNIPSIITMVGDLVRLLNP